MDFYKQILELARGLRFREQWIVGAGGWAVTLIAGLIGALIAPFLPLPWYRLIVCPLGLSIIAWVGWLFWRAVYWRVGKGRRIGLSFDGHRTPPDDWVEVRGQLSNLFENTGLSSRVCLKVFPAHMTATEPRWIRTERRYRLSNLFKMSVEPSLQEGAPPRIELKLRAQFGRQITAEFKQAVEKHAGVLWANPRAIETRRDITRYHADTIFDEIVYHLGTIEFANGNYVAAEIFLAQLNARVLKRPNLPVDTAANLTWLHSMTLVHDSSFPGDAPSHAEELLSSTQRCEKAVQLYGQNLHLLYCTLARNYFYLKQIDRAFEINEEGLKLGFEDFELAMALLNRAVLQLLRGNWNESAAAFDELLKNPTIGKFNWNDLIAFADHAVAYGFPDAIFIRALYRKMVGVPIPEAVRRHLDSWFVDNGRLALRTIYDRTNLPQISMGTKPSLRKGHRSKRLKSKKDRLKKRRR